MAYHFLVFGLGRNADSSEICYGIGHVGEECRIKMRYWGKGE